MSSNLSSKKVFPYNSGVQRRPSGPCPKQGAPSKKPREESRAQEDHESQIEPEKNAGERKARMHRQTRLLALCTQTTTYGQDEETDGRWMEKPNSRQEVERHPKDSQSGDGGVLEKKDQLTM